MKIFVAVFFVLYVIRFGVRLGLVLWLPYPRERPPIKLGEAIFSLVGTTAIALWAGLVLLYP